MFWYSFLVLVSCLSYFVTGEERFFLSVQIWTAAGFLYMDIKD